MTRGVGTQNIVQVESDDVEVVTLAELDFDTPVYVHSSGGTITFDGNDYLGVGDFGSVSDAKEKESIGPSQIVLSLSGVDASLISEALDSGNYRDAVTIYEGYRNSDLSLVEDPWVVWRGLFEYASIRIDETGTISVTCSHDLALLNEKHASRFTDEDQQRRFSGDTFFKFITDQAGIRLRWGGGPGVGANVPEPPRPPGTYIR